MELTLRPATPAERLYAYEQPGEIAGQCGSPGYLWGELDKDSSSTFFSGWVAFDRSLSIRRSSKQNLDLCRKCSVLMSDTIIS